MAHPRPLTVEDQLKSIQEELAKTKYNKATSHHIGKLKAKMAALRELQAKRQAQSGGAGKAFAVQKSGHATVGIVGFPSVGKSTLLNALTNAKSETAAYEFTTLDVIPGLMEHRGADIQILDMPGIIRGAARGRGRGREVLSVARGADLVLLLIDPFNPGQFEALQEELATANIRVNLKPPNIQFTKAERGGVTVNSTVKLTHLDEEMVKDICREFGHINGTVVLREDATQDRLIDALAANRAYLPAILGISKIDLVDESTLKAVVKGHAKKGWRIVPFSAERGSGLDPLKDAIYDALGFMRVFLKPPGKDADLKEPLIVRVGSSVGDVCDNLHRGMKERFRYALVTGRSAKFKEQTVGVEHVLLDGDVLTVVTKRG